MGFSEAIWGHKQKLKNLERRKRLPKIKYLMDTTNVTKSREMT